MIAVIADSDDLIRQFLINVSTSQFGFAHGRSRTAKPKGQLELLKFRLDATTRTSVLKLAGGG